MKKYLALLMLLAISLTGCGFHLQHETEVPERFKTLSYISYDPYGRLSREMKELLHDNKVTLTSNATEKVPSLRMLSENLSRNTISIYQDGKAAEYQLVLTVDAQVVIAGQQTYPINVRVFRTFFDNPSEALAKTVEQDLIENEMFKQAAKQVIRKLKSIDAVN
ncbi:MULTISPECIES: LPS assembly lipoprotein LptE [unclassified Gilliamella]|uniref:LPS assembly lipoprotein LptE n=1 Tax=unclassified Gilliamella TaxID=2685620 RepID=UPI001328D4AF|nr:MULTISPECIES: LPS assembly lipoprotein LptE [unclassified Gilliamella]MWN31189.1 LPS assembly lipoprotein LptE [Gilliamella sp. Pra-s60]MWP29758.1 LPS assembly lipoprotein LptE [Gilliamella sp. Pra-s54]MWP47769.1 LPS assembly lipoprotein LptE [Gilliamella sp. Pas-s27]